MCYSRFLYHNSNMKNGKVSMVQMFVCLLSVQLCCLQWLVGCRVVVVDWGVTTTCCGKWQSTYRCILLQFSCVFLLPCYCVIISFSLDHWIFIVGAASLSILLLVHYYYCWCILSFTGTCFYQYSNCVHLGWVLVCCCFISNLIVYLFGSVC